MSLALVIASCHSEGPTVCTLNSLVIGTQPPASTVAGAPFSMTITAEDNNGGTLACFADNVTVTLSGGQGGATLTGNTSATAANGVATFSGLVITKAGTGYKLTASSGSVTSSPSNAFVITGAAASALSFTTQPASVTAGQAITATVTARDQYLNVATGFTDNVTIAIGTNPGSGTLSGTATVAAVAGVASFAGLSIDKAGTGYTLTATPASGAPPAATSSAFNITPGVVTKLAFSVPPANATGGSVIAPAVVVQGQDAKGNLVPTFTDSVTIAIGTNPGSGTLSGTTKVRALNGAATFNDLSIDSVGTGYTMVATSGSLTGASSASFNVTVGPLAQLTFTAPPSNAVAGAAITPAVKVTGLDAGGNIVTSFAGNVTLAIGTNPGSGTLSGTPTKAAVAGVATFSDLSIKKAANGYTLTASAAGAAQATSTSFDITPAPPAKLTFSVQPGNSTAGSPITPAVKVTALDSVDNVATSFGGSVSVSIATNVNAGTLTGGGPVTAVAGVATFSALSIDSAGAGYTLDATAAGLTDAISSTFDVRPGMATHLAFVQQPTAATAGAAIAPAVTVAALDAKGNVDTSYVANVAVAISSGSGRAGASLTGGSGTAAVAGIATFAALSIDSAGTGYTLTASSGTLATATSSAFAINAGLATHLTFAVQPVNTAAGSAISPAVKVAAQDALGNTDLTYTANVTLAIGTNPSGGTLSGGGPVAAVAGVATFAASINLVGNGYTLTAASGSLTGITSTAFNIFANTATHLIFSVQPANATAGVAVSPAVVVEALDGSNNLATGFTGGVTLSITSGTGDPAATLSGTPSVPAVGGVASFNDVRIDKTADSYTLDATAGGLPVQTSNPFDITPASATHLVFSVQPSTAMADMPIAPAVVVATLDAFGNVDTGYVGSVAVSLGSNPSGAALKGTTLIAVTSGQAAFSDLRIDTSAVGYALHATSGTLRDTTSAPFDITAAALAKLVFTQQPTNAVAGASITPAVAVEGEDAFGNRVTTFVDSVRMTIGVNPATGTLSGDTTVAAIGGVATFSTLSIDKAGVNYKLTAATGGASSATSAPFDITAGTATVLVFTTPPGNTTAGSPMNLVTVTAQDADGNTDPTFADTVLIAIGTNGGTPTQGTLSGPKKVKASNGVATFANLSIDRAGTGYTLTAAPLAGTPPAGATSPTFDIIAGAATQLAFTVQPAPRDTAGQAITPAIQVSAQDALGNTDPTYNAANIVVAITSGTGNPAATLLGTPSRAPSSGVATFDDLSIDKTGSAFTLTATSGTLTDTVSTGFDIVPGTATQLVFLQGPTTDTAGVSIAPTVTVQALDGLGNLDTTYTATMTIQFVNNAGSPVLGTLSGNVVSASGGVASFPSLSIDKVGTGYTIDATDGSLTSIASGPFNITQGPATHLVFSQPPTDATEGATIQPAVTVTALDANDNVATAFKSNVTVGLVSGTLNGTVNMAAVSGVAMFSTLNISTAGPYEMTASSGSLTPPTPAAFNINASVATQLVFTVQPQDTAAGLPIGLNGGGVGVEVTARDASGQTATSFNGTIDVAIASGTGTPGATLSGAVSLSATNGVAQFNDLNIDLAASGYRLTASSTGLTGGTSKFFTIDPGAATALVYSVQPSNATALATMVPPVEVKAVDALGNTVTSFSQSIGLAITGGTGTVGAALTGTVPQVASQGVATFNDLSIDSVGIGYTLDASTSGALTTTLTSSSFNIAAATAHLVFSTQPVATTAGQAINVVLTALGAAGDTLTAFTGDVTVSITAGTGANGATLSGTTTLAAVGGKATFTDLRIDKAHTGYRLSATTPTLGGAQSTSFTINAGQATNVVFTVDPVTTQAGQPIPTVTVQARDDFGNPDATYTGDVSLAISTNPGGGTLSGTTTVAASAGVANFNDLSIDKAGTGYRLTATGAGLAGTDISTAFAINGGAANHLTFTVAPTSAQAGDGTVGGNISNPHIRVTAYDALGNVATGFGDPITLAITSGTGTTGATLGGVVTVAAGGGTAEFVSLLGVDKAGSGYTLSATTAAAGVTGATSATFDITPGTATQLTFIVEPSNTAANATITPAVQVAAQDQFGNTDLTYTGTIGLVIGTNPASGALTGGAAIATVDGVATFSALSINNPGNGYTLSASSSPGLTGATSASFDITP